MRSKFNSLDLVALTGDLPELGLRRGQIGKVARTLGSMTVEVDFVDNAGKNLATHTVPRHHLMLIHHQLPEVIKPAQREIREEKKLRGGYWWKCYSAECSNPEEEFDAVADKGIVTFLWEFARAGWNQGDLRKTCGSCHALSLQVTYAFPAVSMTDTLRLEHLVGLWQENEEYLPMIWESIAESEVRAADSADPKRWFHFNYLGARKKRGANWGLNKAAVFGRLDLEKLFKLFEEKAGHPVL